jgi:hypothetical protein
VVATPAVRAPTDADTRLTVRGCIAWCNRKRGILMFEPKGAGASRMAINFDVGEDDGNVWRVLRPGALVTLGLRWRPECDILSPWQPEEIICATGERFRARP